jgi:hypothetical protein
MAKKKTDTELDAAPEPQATEAPAPNVVWRGTAPPPGYAVEDGNEVLAIAGEPTISIGNFTLTGLPDAATQRAGFYHQYAGKLIESVAGYKRMVGSRAAKTTSPIPAASIPVPDDQRTPPDVPESEGE